MDIFWSSGGADTAGNVDQHGYLDRFLSGVRGRAARRLEKTFLGHMKTLLASAPVLHADETTGRAAGTVSYVHVACTQYLTLTHVGGRTVADIDPGGVLPPSLECWSATATPVTNTSSARCTPGAARTCCVTCDRSPTPTDPDGQLLTKAMADPHRGPPRRPRRPGTGRPEPGRGDPGRYP